MEFKVAEVLHMPVFMMRRILPADEYLKWLSYFAHKRPDVQEQQMARLMLMINRALGGKAQSADEFLVSKHRNAKHGSTGDPVSNTAIKAIFRPFAKPMKKGL